MTQERERERERERGWEGGKLIGWLVGWLVHWLIDWLIDWFIRPCKPLRPDKYYNDNYLHNTYILVNELKKLRMIIKIENLKIKIKIIWIMIQCAYTIWIVNKYQ